ATARRGRSGDSQTLGRQALAQPAAMAVGGIAQSVMQAALAALPELPVVGLEAVASPMGWAGRAQQELRAVLRCVGHQHRAALDHFALRAGPGTDAAVQRAAVEVSVAFFI